jgi:hypothetical protein
MPKNNKKSSAKGKTVPVATAQADDDFEAMLSEIRAADPIATTATGSNTSSSSTSRSSGSFNTIPSDHPSAASGAVAPVASNLPIHRVSEVLLHK